MIQNIRSVSKYLFTEGSTHKYKSVSLKNGLFPIKSSVHKRTDYTRLYVSFWWCRFFVDVRVFDFFLSSCLERFDVSSTTSWSVVEDPSTSIPTFRCRKYPDRSYSIHIPRYISVWNWLTEHCSGHLSSPVPDCSAQVIPDDCQCFYISVHETDNICRKGIEQLDYSLWWRTTFYFYFVIFIFCICNFVFDSQWNVLSSNWPSASRLPLWRRGKRSP